MTTETDVLVIGSGFGAAAVALRLALAGQRVLVIEKGPHIDPYTDFRQTQDPQYLLRYLKSLSGSSIATTFAEALGGGSGFYEMVSLRAPSLAFDQIDASGRRLWPAGIDRAALDPYYERAEAMLHVEQIHAAMSSSKRTGSPSQPPNRCRYRSSPAHD
jgi:choline dehydrogenase-like flavoprotein